MQKRKESCIEARSFIPAPFVCRAFVFLLAAGSLWACEMPTPLPPEEPMSCDFIYRAPAASAEKTSTPITIGILKPQWPKDAIKAEDAFRLLEKENLTLSSPVATPGDLPAKVRSVIDDFGNSFARDYESMLVSRGFTTKGPFDSEEDLTYQDKKDCNLLLRPRCSLNISVSNPTNSLERVSGTANVKWEMFLEILEPLSTEKLWQKRLPAVSSPFEFRYFYSTSPWYDENGTRRGYVRNGLTWDNRAQRLAGALTELYKGCMEKSWKFFSPEEMGVLKTHSDEIRSKKVY